MTAKRPKLTDIDVARAYARRTLEGASAPVFEYELSKLRFARAVSAAILHGVIQHAGDPKRGWLTPGGIALLDPEMQEQYRAALRGQTMMRAG